MITAEATATSGYWRQKPFGPLWRTILRAMSTIKWLDSADSAQESDLGGKNFALRTLTLAGLPVPLVFATTACAFRRVLADAGTEERLTRAMAGIEQASPVALSTAAAVARDLVRRAGMPGWLRTEVSEAYWALSARCGERDAPVAIRSSASSEDGREGSYAGAHDTSLWVRSAGQVTRTVLECWVSLYTERAVAYRRDLGQPEGPTAMSVGVQAMVVPLVAGVAFTLNPRDGDDSMVAIEASWGFGEAVVGGTVTPDSYLVDKATGRVIDRVISCKQVEYRLKPDRSAIVLADVGPARQFRPCLTDGQARAVARLACRSEELFGCPQDVEWAMEAPREGRPGLWLLQSRPETAWRRPPGRAGGPPSPAPAASRCLTGLPASPGVAVGRARVILDIHEVGALKPGEVLVAPKTTPGWLPAFTLVSAIVTDQGGITSHAAITCREYGIPAVTGTAVGTSQIVTGQRVRVDGASGSVVILDHAGPPRKGTGQ